MVRFIVAATTFLTTLLLHVPMSSDAFIPPPKSSASSSSWGVVVLPNKKYMQQQEEKAKAIKISNEEEGMDEDNILAPIEIAQEGLEGKIVGVEDAIADVKAKTEWDAAGALAPELQQNDEDDDLLLDSDEFEGLDAEALGEAARETVETFEDMDEEEVVDEEQYFNNRALQLRVELRRELLSGTYPRIKSEFLDRHIEQWLRLADEYGHDMDEEEMAEERELEDLLVQ
jgi:hypothetical protein